MAEPLTTSLLMELIAKLHVAFPRTIGEKNPAMMADVYRNGLRGLSGDAVRVAVDRCIESEEYFPKVSKIRELASSWDRHRHVAARRVPAWDECAMCGAHASLREVMRETGEKDEQGRKLYEPTGVHRYHIEHNRRGHGLPDHALEDIA